jgi:hypothetical protein
MSELPVTWTWWSAALAGAIVGLIAADLTERWRARGGHGLMPKSSGE